MLLFFYLLLILQTVHGFLVCIISYIKVEFKINLICKIDALRDFVKVFRVIRCLGVWDLFSCPWEKKLPIICTFGFMIMIIIIIIIIVIIKKRILIYMLQWQLKGEKK